VVVRTGADSATRKPVSSTASTACADAPAVTRSHVVSWPGRRRELGYRGARERPARAGTGAVDCGAVCSVRGCRAADVAGLREAWAGTRPCSTVRPYSGLGCGRRARMAGEPPGPRAQAAAEHTGRGLGRPGRARGPRETATSCLRLSGGHTRLTTRRRAPGFTPWGPPSRLVELELYGMAAWAMRAASDVAAMPSSVGNSPEFMPSMIVAARHELSGSFQ